MSKRAERAAANMYPVEIVGYSTECRVGAKPKPLDWNEGNRAACAKGYRKGEEDAIKRATKWLRSTLAGKSWSDNTGKTLIINEYGTASKLVSAFKQAMLEDLK